MSMLNPPKTVSRRHELREDQLATATARGMTFFEEHRTLIIGVAAALLVVVAGAVVWKWYQARQDRAAAEALGGILNAYESGDYQQALEGTPEAAGLLDIASQYGSTNTGNLATFFAADALYQLGRYDEALERFEDYDGDRDILGASALAGEAAVYEQRGDHARAAALYLRAADAYASAATTPGYLLAAGRNFEAAEDYERAQAAYQRYLDDWEDDPNVALAKIFLARAQAEAAHAE